MATTTGSRALHRVHRRCFGATSISCDVKRTVTISPRCRISIRVMRANDFIARAVGESRNVLTTVRVLACSRVEPAGEEGG